MALLGYLSLCELTIPSSQVPADCTNLPVPFYAGNLPSEILSATVGCKDDGGDIRFSLDQAGNTELPRDIVHVDKAAGEIFGYVKVPNLSSSSDTTIYIHWRNGQAEEPGGSSPSAASNVWSEYYGVFHYREIATGWKGIKDTAGKWSNKTVNGTIDTSVGHVPGSQAIRLSATFGCDLHENMNWQDETNVTMFWVNFEGTHSTGLVAQGTNDAPLNWIAGGRFQMEWGGFKPDTDIPATGWHWVCISNDNGVVTYYVNGVESTRDADTAKGLEFDTWGMRAETGSWLCSEMRRTRDVVFDVGYIQTMYEAELNPGAFMVPGIVQEISASVSVTVNVVDIDTGAPIQNARVRVTTVPSGDVVLEGLTDASGMVTGPYSAATPQQISGRVRKATPPDKLYKQGRIIGTIEAGGFNVTIPLSSDE